MHTLITPFAYLLSFLFVFTIVVFVHESGHFWAARMLGIKIDAFSIGFGRALATWKDKYGTIWKISALPLGGYVKFAGDENAASVPDHEHLDRMKDELTDHGQDLEATKDLFHFSPTWKRAIVTAAGPVMNFIFAVMVFGCMLLAYGDVRSKAVISRVLPDTPAATAGFANGDVILKVNGEKLRSFQRLAGLIQISANDPMRFQVNRGGVKVDLVAVPEGKVRKDPFGKDMKVGFLGVEGRNQDAQRIRLGVLGAFAGGASMTSQAITDQLGFFVRLFRGRGSAEMIGGPLRVMFIAGQVGTGNLEAQADLPPPPLSQRFISLILLAGSLSVAIGLINLAPVPVLDGGHLLFYGWEEIFGQPVSERSQMLAFKLGFSAILCLLAFATFNDLRYFNVLELLRSSFS